MADVSETISQEQSKLEARQDTGAQAGEEGLSGEVRAKMEAGREHAAEIRDNLIMEQAGNAALGENLPGDVAGQAVEEEIEPSPETTTEAGLSPEVQARMAASRERQEAIATDLAMAQNEQAAVGDDMPGDVAGEGLEGTTSPEDREAAARAAEQTR